VQPPELKQLLEHFYPEKPLEEADDPAMTVHLRLLLERAEDALDREKTARLNRRTSGGN
jgi:hypothetical protein